MMSSKLKLRVRLSAIALLPILTACGAMTTTAGTEGSAMRGASFCEIAQVIKFSRLRDTLETIEQIKEHNAVIEKLCQQAAP